MFVLPAITALFVFVFIRPHDVFEALKLLNFNLIAGTVVWAYVMDLRLGVVRLRTSALPALGTAFLLFCVISHAIKAPDSLTTALPVLGASLLVLLLVSQGLQSFRAIEVAATVLLVITLLLATIGAQQAFSQQSCFAYSADSPNNAAEVSDGRSCEQPEDCLEGGLPETKYICEHAGWFGTRSIAGRVRYRGILQDPNELAWAVSMGAPLAFALYGRKRSLVRLVALIAMLVLGGLCVIKTQSRSGQLTFAAMLGTYFVRRFGWRGALAAVVSAAPVLFLGGRSGEDAHASTEERLECWAEGFNMLRANPLLGVGHGQFTEHHYLTAHSALVLTLAELGPLGFSLWTAVVYFAFKITIRAQIEFAHTEEAAAAKTWSMALLASLVGTLVSAIFLSIPYHPILWIDLGLTGALATAISAHQPSFRVRFGWRDVAIVLGGDVAIVGGLKLYLKMHGA